MWYNMFLSSDISSFTSSLTSRTKKVEYNAVKKLKMIIENRFLETKTIIKCLKNINVFKYFIISKCE